MIRRPIQFDDGARGWLLISQVEHARLSGELTRAWRDAFEAEVLEAIAHHDDGWAAWEAAPRIDPARGRPLSFLEMPMAESLAIWDASIAAARRIGLLAGAIVAGHFIELAAGSDQSAAPPASDWLRDTAERRAAWLSQWQRASCANTPDVAQRAQRMLLVADLLSLWLCCDGPVTSLMDDAHPNTEMRSRTESVLGKYCFQTSDQSIIGSEIVWRGSLAPWPFAAAGLELTAPAIAVPVARYASWPEIVAASRRMTLDWRLQQTLPSRAEC